MKSGIFAKKYAGPIPARKNHPAKVPNGKAPEAKHALGFEKDASCKVGQN